MYQDEGNPETSALISSRQEGVAARGASAAPFWNAASPTENGNDIWELFEVYRRSANRYVNQYFDCLDRIRASSAELDARGRSQEIAIREGSEAENDVWLLKISHDSAMRDLTALNQILYKAREEERPLKRSFYPAIALGAFACSIFSFVVPNRLSSALLKVGAFAGALVIAFHLVRKPPRAPSVDLVQHKVQEAIRLFEESAMQKQDRAEVLIPPMDLGSRH